MNEMEVRFIAECREFAKAVEDGDENYDWPENTWFEVAICILLKRVDELEKIRELAMDAVSTWERGDNQTRVFNYPLILKELKNHLEVKP